MGKLLCKFSFTLVMLCMLKSNAYSQDEFQKIEHAVTTYLKADADPLKLKSELINNTATFLANGSWPEIDYTSKAETNWMPLTHLNRLKQFALAIAIKEPSTIGNARLTSQITTALRYWLQLNPRSNNWFQNDIASPTAIGEILLLLKVGGTILPGSLKDSLVLRMRQGNVVKNVGSNKMDIAVHMLYRACLTRNKQLMDSAVTQAFLPITLNNKEGLQPDYAYRQHGPQMHIASYGQVFLTAEYKFASWVTGTPYALPPEKLKILDHYLINTFLKTIRGRYIDFNTEGRGISRNDLLDKQNITAKKGANTLLALAKAANPANAQLFAAAEERLLQTKPASFQISPSHTYFYTSDYTLHTRPAYSFNVRTVSKRTIRTETGNKENLIGKFLPDGATNIQRTGDEYQNIMPLWEWDKIPGITARDYPVDQKTTLEWGERGIGEFTGGVTDGLYGATVYQFDYNEVTAKKAWFFFDDEVVCLGAAINSFAREPIATTVNQAWQKEKVKVSANHKLLDVNKVFTGQDVDWVWHDSIGYYFPNRGKICITADQQIGSWVKINANRSKEQLQGKVFKLWLDHGIDPINASYAYIVKPGVGQAEMDKRLAVEILENNESIQAVLHKDLQVTQVAFHRAGTLTYHDQVITVDQPCLVMIKAINTAKPTAYVSDPSQKLTDVHLSFSSPMFKLVDPISISLNMGDHKGATVGIELNSF
ncbi:polysaccharide lyase family 8 super-sandwich domain-containing protein [Pedobacter duraquae]|uniref:Chondroitin AC lyase n=1 Tax=Pedobacter duraquae TaxID=425511 RepID=A0A4R6INX8_9SPHI|nr:polysaccharide lyase family 8 super-sandwich domain-containing protein [Pedobacter duraquae]TDO23887.1 chondroitin AC lyase [Pedobacter duraquae]